MEVWDLFPFPVIAILKRKQLQLEAVYHRIPFHPSYLPYLTPDTLDPGFS